MYNIVIQYFYSLYCTQSYYKILAIFFILCITFSVLFIFYLVVYTAWSAFPEKAMAPHSSTLAWKIPWMEEPGELQSMGSHRVGHNWRTSLSLFTFMHSSVLAWRIPGMGEPGGLPSMGSHRVGHDWSDLAAAAVAAEPIQSTKSKIFYYISP